MSGLCEKCADKACTDYYHGIVECQDFQPMTNADHIRAMTDEELAGFISVMSSCNGCKAKSSETAHPCLGLYEGCKGNWLDWLKQEVDDVNE